MFTYQHKYFLFLFILSFVIISLVGAVSVEAAKVAVISFEADDMSWTDDREFARQTLRGISRQYTEKMANEDIVEVVDRSRVEEVLKQLNYESGEKLSLSYAAQMARMLDCNLLILGRLEKLDVAESGELSIGSFSLSGVEVNVKLSARLVDTISGDVLANYSGSGLASDTGFEISNLTGISFGSEAFTDSAAGKAIEEALNKLLSDTVAEKEKFAEGTKIPEAKEISAEVVAKVGESLVINKGSEDGIQEEQQGELKREVEIEGREDPLYIALAQIIVSSVDSNTALVKAGEAEEKPEVGDIVNIKISVGMTDTGSQAAAESFTSGLKRVETSDFIIHIDRVTRSGNKATFHGTAEAKNGDTELTLIFPSGYNFYDHKGQRRVGRYLEICIGNSNRDDGYTHRGLTELVLAGYPVNISWSFGRIPEDAEHLARVKLYLETPAAGEVEINLNDVPLVNKF